VKLFRRRSNALAHNVILPLNDPRLAEHARRLADFAADHSGEGHALRKVRSGEKGQTIVCRCGVPVFDEPPPDALLALVEDEIIDDDSGR
jgi:hypothetical protein